MQDAAALRGALVDQLIADGAIRSAGVEAAIRTVPRHVFAPTASLEEAYGNTVLPTKRDEHGVTMSSVSAPWLQAVMLEQAELAPGMRCLEIGSGGYNAALMAELVGRAGEATTVDIDPDVSERARRCLAEAGYPHVKVVLADAETGVEEHAPYDRIIVTAGAWDIPPAWVAQLTATGRLVVPLRMRGLSRSVAFDRVGDQLISREHVMAGFVPVQGEGQRREQLVPLHGEDVCLRVDESESIDHQGLREALTSPRAEAWSGVRFGRMEPFDDLFLWLATRSPTFCLLTRTRTDAARALVDPASPIGTPTIVAERSFVYLTFREADQDASPYEFGAYAHGPAAQRLAGEMNDEVRRWDHDHRRGPAARIVVHPASTTDEQLGDGHVIDKRHTRITISWPVKSDASATGGAAEGHPLVAVCYIVEGGRLLMVRRAQRQGGLEWAGPSGNVEPGETAEEAAVREVREEVGLEVEVVRRLGDRVHPATDRHLVYFACRVIAGQANVVDHEEITAVEWCDLPTALERWAGLRGGVYPPVRAYLEEVMGAHVGGKADQRLEGGR